ncbi:hypothetical protein KXD97_10030 [Mycobacterium sp. SMC-8]|uniref:hypothetical protein n=1 Tax=Mycobacterium sp. SMC-8 TaxID=2857060 RepID=UPI0021B3062F|nr:hypothetical protein [Mycobacterium sp. SMC-8]UXA14080.1 hypothetical protein KXD97_10030 [Mycobacterium sp. SMC-8]
MTALGVLVCHRATETGPITVEWTYWENVEEARRAEAVLSPCSDLCVLVHSVVSVELDESRQ